MMQGGNIITQEESQKMNKCLAEHGQKLREILRGEFDSIDEIEEYAFSTFGLTLWNGDPIPKEWLQRKYDRLININFRHMWE